jgi:hypothetical protein
MTRKFLLRALAYRIQENAFKGLSKATRRRLERIAADVAAGKPITKPGPKIKPGMRLLREWNGVVHEVIVLADSARAAGLDESKVASLIHLASQSPHQPLDLVTRIDLSSIEITIRIALSSFLEDENGVISHIIPAQLKRSGVERRLVLRSEASTQDRGHLDYAMIKGIARARKWFEDLSTGRARSLGDIAKAEGVSEQYVSKLMPLAFLAPGIVQQILAGTQPADLSVEDLIKRVDLPLAWNEQYALLGFR